MEELEIGLRIEPAKGFAFFGLRGLNMTKLYLTPEQEAKLAEAYEIAKELDRKLREGVEFTIAMDEKYKKRMEEIRKVSKESVSVTE